MNRRIFLAASAASASTAALGAAGAAAVPPMGETAIPLVATGDLRMPLGPR